MIELLGKPVAESLLSYVQSEIQKNNLHLCLVAVLVGDNAASSVYIAKKKEAAERVGMEFRVMTFPTNITQEQLESEITKLNNDDDITGYIIQLPLPPHLEMSKILQIVDPKKDVDGFHPLHTGALFGNAPQGSYLPPATSRAVMHILDFYKIPLSGKHAVVLGRGMVTGKPVALELLNRDCTVTICHSKTDNLKSYITQADIVVSSLGKPHFLKQDMFKPGSVLVDVGFSRVNNSIRGDIDPTDIYHIAGALAPVPGGVGPVTVSVLMENTLTAYFLQHPHATQ